MSADRIETPLGAHVAAGPAPGHIGKGLMLRLGMVDPADPRVAEVYLDWNNVAQVRDLLDHLLGKRAEIDKVDWA